MKRKFENFSNFLYNIYRKCERERKAIGVIGSTNDSDSLSRGSNPLLPVMRGMCVLRAVYIVQDNNKGGKFYEETIYYG